MPSYLKQNVVFFALLGLLSACWEPKEFEVLRVVPGVINLTGARAVAVGEVTGPEGERVGHGIAEGLMGQSRFSVLDWSSAHGKGQYGGGWADPQGGWQTADAAILGSVRAPRLVPEYEARSAITTDGSQITTYGRSWRLTVNGTFRVVNPHNGSILSSTTASGESQSPVEYCTVAGPEGSHDSAYLDSLFAPAPVELLHDLALDALADELVALLMVGHEPARVTLYNDATRPEFADVIKEATLGHWQPAVQAYGQAVLEYEEHSPTYAYMAHHNYGVALAFGGDLEAGIKELQVAYALRKDKVIAQTLAQVQALERLARGATDDAEVKQ